MREGRTGGGGGGGGGVGLTRVFLFFGSCVLLSGCVYAVGDY